MTGRLDRIGFDIVGHGGAEAVVPVIGGRRLTDVVHDFERGHGWTPEDAYGGLIPAFFRFGPMADHYRGATADGPLVGDAGTPVLGCACGEWGCWPLLMDASSDDRLVTWSRFRQPNRPQQRYTGLGPFRFDRRQFDQAAAALDRFTE